MRTFRKAVPQAGGNITIPEGIKFVVVQNIGLNKMVFNFDDDGATDYFSLEVDKQTPIMHIQAGQKFNFKGIGGDTIIEALAWS